MSSGDALDQLEALVGALDAPSNGEDLRQAFAILDVLTAKVTNGAGAFDAAGGWGLDACRSLPAWLRQHARRGDGNAWHTGKVARRLRSLSLVAAAWETGALSTAHVDAIVANVTDRTLPLFIEQEVIIVQKLSHMNTRDAVREMKLWAIRADALVGPDGSDGSAKSEPERQLFVSQTFGGRGEIRGHADPESTDLLNTGLRLAERDDRTDENRSMSERRADALLDIVRYFLDHQTSHVGGRHRPHVNVVVGVDNLGKEAGTNLDGTVVYTSETISTLLCDANIHRVVTRAGSSILDFGHATRSISPALYTSLVLRDRGCTFQDCDEGPERCQGHHVQHWPDGGETNLANLRLRCWFHHHLVHQKGWWEKLLPDGTVETHAPDGRVFVSKLRTAD